MKIIMTKKKIKKSDAKMEIKTARKWKEIMTMKIR